MPKKRISNGNSPKKSNNESKEKEVRKPKILPSQIGNKMKRIEVYQRLKAIKKKEKKTLREKKKKEAQALGDKAPPKQIPRTLENTREPDDTTVLPEDVEVEQDKATDEFANYFSSNKAPLILITTCVKPSSRLLKFVDELLTIFPNSHYYKRRTFSVKQILRFCTNRGFTDVIVINEDRKQPNGFLLAHLPKGPTAYFRLSSVKLREEIEDSGKPTTHYPEVMCNNFSTRLGHTISRMFSSLFPQKPNLHGRRVCTFHNQRDFIFFRHHRFIFDSKKDVRIQELGPRFTLKLRTLQQGLFRESGEYEFVHKNQLVTSRRKFFL